MQTFQTDLLLVRVVSRTLSLLGSHVSGAIYNKHPRGKM